MASFSPSPAPRRSSRLRQQDPNSPSRRFKLPGSRLATPAYGAGDVRASVAPSLMEVDETSGLGESIMSTSNGRMIFAKSDRLEASFYANLPAEVARELRNADFTQNVYSGDVDLVTGFSLVTSDTTCFVWQHAQALKGIPTCYIFACPPGYRTNPPFHELVPFGSSQEPGLVLVSTTGDIRFWDNIAIGLAGGDHYASNRLPLAQREIVTHFVRADSQTFIASTSSGSFYRLNVASTGGSQHLTYHAFSRPTNTGALARLLPSIFQTSASSSNIQSRPANVNSVALGASTDVGTDVWALADTRIQKWNMSREGWEELVLDEEAAEAIRSKLRSALGKNVANDDARLDLELVDLAVELVDGTQPLVVLTSYAGPDDDFAMTTDIQIARRCYALVYLTFEFGQLKADRVISVPYQSTSSSGAPMHPRIQLSAEGKLFCVQFGDAVAIASRDSDYIERLELHSSSDQTLGVGASPTDPTILVLTATTMMKATVNLQAIQAFNKESGRAELIKSTMTQAILYGSLPSNPLRFNLPPKVDEEGLMHAATQLSDAVLSSDPEIVRPSYDLDAQLTSRKERLSWLIKFINDNAALTKLPQTIRQKLASDAEKLYASHQLWLQQNALLLTNPEYSVLNDLIYAHMAEYHNTDDDYMRSFFREHISDIGEVASKVSHITLNLASETGRPVLEMLPEANRIVITVLESAFQYREYNAEVYGVEQPMIDAWTSTTTMIEVLTTLFNTTARSVDPMSTTPEAEPYSQLPTLATLLFACYQERIEWLTRIEADGAAERERNTLEDRFSQLRPDVLETLRKLGHERPAFQLAEQYRDFSSLVDLCHKDTVYPPDRNPHAGRIQSYIDRYGEAFTSQLYRWYIQHGEARTMFSQDVSHSSYLDGFFDTHPHPSISWIHDLGKGRHLEAATALLTAANEATNLEAKYLMLSIGRLCHLARYQKGEAAADEPIATTFSQNLDFIAVQQDLLQKFKAIQASIRGRRSIESELDVIVDNTAPSLNSRPTLMRVYRNLVHDMLLGKVPSVEDTVDVLTLPDNEDSIENYSTALSLLHDAEGVPDARLTSAKNSVWRRMYLHDDWNTIHDTTNVTDREVAQRYRATALYATLYSIYSSTARTDQLITPDEALVVPTRGEIASRWPGMPEDEVEALMVDYDWERDTLGEVDLEGAYARVGELVKQDLFL